MAFARLNDAKGIVELLQTVAAADGELNRTELERIAKIQEDLEQLPSKSMISPAMVLALVFDVAIADGQLHSAEAAFLSELADASDWLGVTWASLRAAWDTNSSYHASVRRAGLHNLQRDGRKYSVGHAVVDICSAMRRRGATDIRVHISRDSRSLAITGTVGVCVGAPTEILGIGESPRSQALLTRSTGALELHVAAAGSLVANSTSVLMGLGREVVIATSFGGETLARPASVTSLAWAEHLIRKSGGDCCILLEDVEGVEAENWRAAVFQEIVQVVDRRLHRWGARDCPGGPVKLWIDNFLASHGGKDPFRRDVLPRRVLSKFVEPRPGLVLQVRVHRLIPLEMSVAQRISIDQEMVQCLGVMEGLVRGLPAPGVFLYDDSGRCLLSEYFPSDTPEHVSKQATLEIVKGLARHRVRVDVLERPQAMQSIDCLNFASLWSAVRQCMN